MSKTVVGNLMGHSLIIKARSIAERAARVIDSCKSGTFLSDDIRYSIYFYRSLIPALYSRHIADDYRNCLFCNNLTKSEFHRSCLLCSKGTYDKCYIPLPGLLYTDPVSSDNDALLPMPWYFMKTCNRFERLPKSRYYRNLHFLFSSVTIHNYETLEGLENGVSSGIRPCHICACVDYDLYKRCKKQGDYDTFSPCLKIRSELANAYERLPSSNKACSHKANSKGSLFFLSHSP